MLSVLQKPPFENNWEIPLLTLLLKVNFIMSVAFNSAPRVSELAAFSCTPYLVVHKDEVVLRPCPSFLPKVVSDFHLNEDIVLPSLCYMPWMWFGCIWQPWSLFGGQTLFVIRRATERVVCFFCYRFAGG